MQETKEKKGKLEKMTLKDYYYSLDRVSAPRKEFLKEIADKCGVDVMTARNWVVYGMRPRDGRNQEILSEMTGISMEKLWE